jgi:hypothetical protein
MDASFGSVKVVGEASYCTIVDDFQTPVRLQSQCSMGRQAADIDVYFSEASPRAANAFSRAWYHMSAYPREYPVSMFSEYTIKYAITVKCIPERVAFS